MHYRYYGDILTITVLKTYKGTTVDTINRYEIRCADFSVMQFVVVPMNDSTPDLSSESAINPSFTSQRTAMSYLLETPTGHYLPASNNIGPEIEITYVHPDHLTISIGGNCWEKPVTASSSTKHINPIFIFIMSFKRFNPN